MCGIVGVLNLTTDEPVDARFLAFANDTMQHRGPNGGGVWSARGIGLAARRLSIIDVPHGQQPMVNEDGTVHLVYNGEVYNHADLRQELAGLGHRFRSTCDTEVILHAYEQWGTDGCVTRLRGMFAFALWDERSQTLLLARDRMGKKPLYLSEWEGRLYFASEIRALLACSKMSREVNTAALPEFLSAGFLTGPQTMYRGVRKLPPAHYFRVTRGVQSMHRYWRLTFAPDESRSDRETGERFAELLHECVRLRLMSEVPLGALLSGGIDSTTVVAAMQGMLARPVTTVSVGFERAAYDESALARTTARLLGTDHHPITFTGDSMDDFPAALEAREEPLGDATFVAMYKLFQACRQQGLTVVLTGEGADELLGGYYWHREDERLRRILRLPHAMRSMLASLPLGRLRGDAGIRMQRILRRDAATVPSRYMDWIGPNRPGDGASLLSPEFRVGSAGGDVGPPDSWLAIAAEVETLEDFDRMLWLQSRTRMVDRINHNVDRMSMAHSIEARPVFLDHVLWEFCATVPRRMKLGRLWARGSEKHLLRVATKGMIPEAVRVRKKKGLSVPAGEWLRRERLPAWAEEALSGPGLRRAGLFDPERVADLRLEHRRGTAGGEGLLLGVLSVQLWKSMFVG
jgi:asparagine synthase (glutamine-hydrolysing)